MSQYNLQRVTLLSPQQVACTNNHKHKPPSNKQSKHTQQRREGVRVSDGSNKHKTSNVKQLQPDKRYGQLYQQWRCQPWLWQ